MKYAARSIKPIAAMISLMLVLALAFCAPIKAFADSEGILSIEASCGGNTVSGFKWKVFRIGERNISGDLVLSETYASSGVTFEDLSDEAVKQSAETINKFIFENAVQADAELFSDENGKASYTGEAGIYFLSAVSADIGDYHYTSSPAIVEVRAGETAEVNPKMESEKLSDDSPTPGDDSQPHGSDDSSKPEDDSNSGRQTGADDESGEDSGTPSKLPQTGQLWWPVPVLAAGGLVLVAFGVRVVTKKDGNDEK